MSGSPQPYRSTAEFTDQSLPDALRRAHSTKDGTWGVIRLFEGELRLSFEDGSSDVLTPDRPGLIRPQEVHWVEPLGTMRMQVDFYDSEPAL